MKQISSLINVIDRIFQLMLIGFMIEITLVISVAVISRYFLNSPVYWAEEVTRYSFVWATFIGAATAFKRKELVAMTVVVNSLPQRTRTLVLLALEFTIAAFLVLTLVFGVRMALVVGPQLAVSTRISMTWLYGVVPVSAFFMLLCSVNNLYELACEARGRGGRP